MRFLALFAAAAAFSSVGAHAATKEVQYGPTPAWVIPAPGPTSASAPEGAPVRIIYTDWQTRLGAAGDETYTAYRMKILTPEGLTAGNIVAAWNPSTDDIVVHSLRLIRGNQTIDVLSSDKFKVIQREGGLDYAMLDGQLTATLQIQGLQIGDELEFSATIRRREAIFSGRSHGFAQLPTIGSPGAYRIRLVWPQDKSIKLSGTPDLGKLTVQDQGGEHELRYELRDPQSSIATDQAPARYNIRRVVEYSEFSSWGELSGIFAPLYDKAAQLSADSPVRAQAADIARTTSDPLARAQAALQLVEDQIRYVYVGLDGGNYRPANADDTWKRRFGDCKGKTVLLMALLRELGVQSEAVLVNSKGGDGTDQRLPTPQMFDHVLIRATIGSKTYWLDGTRLGDKRLSAAPQTPFRWALPLRASGAALEPIKPEAPSLPLSSVVLDIDARAGFAAPAKIFAEEVNRKDEAQQIRLQLSRLSHEDADRALKAYWRQGNPWMQPSTVSWRFDDRQQALVLTMRGEGKPEWEGNDQDGRGLDVYSAGFTPPNELKRPAEQDQTAPWANDFPHFNRWTTIIRLPPDTPKWQWGYFDAPVDRKLGGESYYREAELQGGVLRSTMSIRSYEAELSTAEAAELNEQLPDFNNKISRVYQQAPIAPEPSPAQAEAKAGKDSKQLLALGAALFGKGQWKDAARVFGKALTIDPADPNARMAVALSKEKAGDVDGALKALDVPAKDSVLAALRSTRAQILLHENRKEAAIALLDAIVAGNPDRTDFMLGVAQQLAEAGERDRALALISTVLKRQADSVDAHPSSRPAPNRAGSVAEALREIYAHQLRGQIFDKMGRTAEALDDFDAAVRLQPEAAINFRNRSAVLEQLGRRDDALADLEEAWRINPLDASIVSARTALMRRAGRAPETPALFDAWVARDRSGLALNGRCWARAAGNVELAEAEADCAQAVALAPKSGSFWDSYALVALRTGRLDEAVKRYDKALELSPRLAPSLYGRGLTKLKAGDKAGGEADLAAASQINPKIAQGMAEDAGLKPE